MLLINLAFGAINNYKYHHNIKTNFIEQLLNFKISKKKVVSKLEVNLKRKNINYIKNIFIIMTKEMEQNIQKDNNIQYFSDVTYYCIPPNQYKYKLFILLAFNKDLYKRILCNISLISNENIETFTTLLEYLKNKYQFNPSRVTIDFSKAEFNSFKNVFPDITIIPCLSFLSKYNQKVNRIKIG